MLQEKKEHTFFSNITYYKCAYVYICINVHIKKKENQTEMVKLCNKCDMLCLMLRNVVTEDLKSTVIFNRAKNLPYSTFHKSATSCLYTQDYHDEEHFPMY